MNAIDLLTKQHRTMEAGLEKALNANGAARRRAFDEVADWLSSHVLTEERIFYPAVKATQTESILLESLEEHLAIKRLLADLLELNVNDEHFEPKLHVLKEQSEHHHKEEEEKLFPKVRKLLSRDELETLGAQMAIDQTKLLRSEPSEIAAEQTDAAADL